MAEVEWAVAEGAEVLLLQVVQDEDGAAEVALVRGLLEDELRGEEEVFEGESRPLEAASRPGLHSVDQVAHQPSVHLGPNSIAS